jgi:lipopolysaccharide export system protein LptC
MDARNLLSIGGVLLVLGGVGYYWGLEPEQLTTPSDTAVRRPDYEVRGIRVTESGKDGHLLRRLDSPGLRHYVTPHDEGILESPDMRLYDQGREAWHIRAAQAISLANGKEIRLEGGVIAERSAPAALPVRFTTPSLTAWPEEERLHSATGIQLQSSDGAISGQSLRAGLKTGTIEINQNVTGTYAPAPR